MRFRLAWRTVAISALLACAPAVAQQSLTVDQLLSFIRSSIKLKQPDRQVAAYVAKLKLSERLDERTVEELQGEGAGPKTVAALNELASQSGTLPKPQPKAPKPAPPPIPPPPPEEQQQVISEVREYAMNYSKSLPDFICTEVTRRYVDPTGMEFWQTADTITARLTYFDQKENYKLTLVNNHYVDLPYESVGGASSAGDFGSLLRLTLARKADAVIEFERWATLRGKRAYVFSYRVSSGNSEWSILWERSMRIITGYQGLIYVDKDTHQILRITLQAVDIPSSFPVQEAGTVLDYDYVKIGDREFLLPLKAVVRMRHDKYLTKNEKEFRLYRKFSADAEIKFDAVTPDPLPEDQTKEQPAK
ncbi:MAG TPA: hypothetical protein VMT32_18115 [Bryobacteraceae bacterium]|nr:hypothetical protein [Bryobacteraceae bacterium]